MCSIRVVFHSDRTCDSAGEAGSAVHLSERPQIGQATTSIGQDCHVRQRASEVRHCKPAGRPPAVSFCTLSLFWQVRGGGSNGASRGTSWFHLQEGWDDRRRVAGPAFRYVTRRERCTPLRRIAHARSPRPADWRSAELANPGRRLACIPGLIRRALSRGEGRVCPKTAAPQLAFATREGAASRRKGREVPGG
jgi:hypothetical protein